MFLSLNIKDWFPQCFNWGWRISWFGAKLQDRASLAPQAFEERDIAASCPSALTHQDNLPSLCQQYCCSPSLFLLLNPPSLPSLYPLYHKTNRLSLLCIFSALTNSLGTSLICTCLCAALKMSLSHFHVCVHSFSTIQLYVPARQK